MKSTLKEALMGFERVGVSYWLVPVVVKRRLRKNLKKSGL